MRFQSIVTNPFVLFGVFFSIIHLFLPYFQWKTQFFRYQNSYDETHYIYSMLYVMLAYIIVYMSYMHFTKTRKFIILNSKLENKSTNTFGVNYKSIFRISLVVFMIGGYFAYQNFSLISLLGQEEYLSDRIGLGKGRGLQVLLSHWIYVSSILFFYLWLTVKDLSKRYKKIIFLMFILSAIIAIGYYGFNSNRNSIFILIVNLSVLYYAFKPQIRKRRIKFASIARIGAFITILILLFYQLGKNRRQSVLNDSTADYTIIETLNGAFGNHENIVWLLENDNNTKLYYGATYMAGITNFVPRSIWPQKPLGAGPILKNTIYPGSYVVGEQGNSSLTTGLFTELQMNFGIFGIFLGAILYGLLLSKVGIMTIQTTNPISLIIIQYILIVFSSVFIYAEFLGFLSRFIITLIPFFIIKFLINKQRLETNHPIF